jgi:hypothetical protein
MMLITLAAALPAAAFCPRPDATVCAEASRSALVMTGVVLSETHVGDEDADDGGAGWEYRIRVARTFRGERHRVATVFTENASARLRLDVGRAYVVFAYRDHAGRLAITSCGNTRPLAGAEAQIKELSRLSSSGSWVQGHVALDREWRPAAGFLVRVTGTHGVKTTTTDANGWFSVQVEPGRYGVTTVPATQPYDLSWDPPDDVDVPRNGCGLVQLVQEWPS